MVPHVAPAQPNPETLHVTAVLLVPVTDALNNCWAPVFTSALAGVTVTLIGLVEVVIVTVVEPDTDVFVKETAVTITVAGFGAVVGAV
jgi:hypothetical protein